MPVLGQPAHDRVLPLLDAQPVELARVDEMGLVAVDVRLLERRMLVAILRVNVRGVAGAVTRSGLARRDDPHDRQPEHFSKLKIALVMSRYRHDGAGAVLHEHVVGDPDWDRLAGCWIRRVRTGEHTRFLAIDL